MIKKIGTLTIILLISILVINFGYSQAYLINGGFEDTGLVDNDGNPKSIGDGKWTENKPIPGWEIIGDTDHNYYGVFNPSINYYFDEAPEGNYTAYLENYQLGNFGYMGLEQTFYMDLEAETTYYLHVDIGNTKHYTYDDYDKEGVSYDGFPGYKVELWKNDDLIVQDDNSKSPLEGKFATTTLAFNAPSAGDNEMTIRLLNIGTDGLEVNFDNVRINTNPAPVPTPEPSTMLLLGLGLVGLAGLKRRKK